MKRFISKSEAIQLVNTGKHVYSDIEDGYLVIHKKSVNLYRIEIFTLESQPTVFEGNYKEFLKTMNNKFTKDLYIEEFRNEEDSPFCEYCQEKFDAQLGELALNDMCEECQTKTLKSILEESKM